MDFTALIRAFGIPGICQDCEELFVGNINQTYKLRFAHTDGSSAEYIVQKLNTYVFKNPREVMDNIQRVTDHIRQQPGMDDCRRVLHFLTAADGTPYVENETGFWRAYRYIDRARTYDTVSARHFEQAGFAFGQFQGDLAGFPVQTLWETIPHFHDTPDRMRQLRQAIREDKAGRAASVQPEIRFILEREADAGIIVEALQSGRIPLRVTHNDTKINNVLFDVDTDAPICVIDLDTVMPGSALYDYGDAIRSGANTAGEDEEDLALVHFDLSLFERFTVGYLRAAGDRLTREEIRLFPQAARILTLELCARFLTDYLNGDEYFKVKKPGHNLIRTRNQIELVRQMESQMPAMTAIVRQYGG